MLDLDHFQAVNDTYGHEADNFVLGHISSLIKKSVRRLDIPGRYEGEEFTIILPNTTLRQGIRLIIENPLARTSDALLGIEASLGVEVYVKGDELIEKEYVEKIAIKPVTLPLKLRIKTVQLRRSFMQKALALTLT